VSRCVEVGSHTPLQRILRSHKIRLCYAPLQPNGNGIQSVYLTELHQDLAETLAGLIGSEAQSLIGSVSVAAPVQTSTAAGSEARRPTSFSGHGRAAAYEGPQERRKNADWHGIPSNPNALSIQCQV
jgi:hypothetical protein